MLQPVTVDRPLIILGASARAAAQAAVRAGFQPYSIDLFGDLDLQEIGPAVQIARYPTEFLTALAAAPQAPWIYTGSLENYPRLVARLGKLRPLIGNGPEALTKVRDPRWLAEVLAGSAVRFPETRSEVGGQRAEGRSWLMKPLRSGGGMGIRRIDPTSDLRSPISDLCPPTSDFCLQQVIAGQPCSASFIATDGETHWISATEQWIGPKWGAPQEFQYAGSFAPLEISGGEEESLLEVAQQLSKAAGLRGLFGLDLIRNDEGLWLIEVNPRYTASMELLERITGRSLIAEHCAAFELVPASGGGGGSLGGRGSRRVAYLPIDSDQQQIAKLIVYSQSAGSAGKTLHGVLQSLLQQGIQSADLPRPGTLFEAGNPICTLLTSGDSREQIESKLLSASVLVRGSLEKKIAREGT